MLDFIIFMFILLEIYEFLFYRNPYIVEMSLTFYEFLCV